MDVDGEYHGLFCQTVLTFLRSRKKPGYLLIQPGIVPVDISFNILFCGKTF